MKITQLEPFILHAPVTRGGIADSTHSITHWGAPGVAIHTDTGLTGYGFSGTHALDGAPGDDEGWLLSGFGCSGGGNNAQLTRLHADQQNLVL